MKKAEVTSQMFTFIMTLIIVGVILLVGVKFIILSNDEIDKIDTIKLKVSMEREFEQIKKNFGSWRNVEFEVPDGINKVCFVDNAIAMAERSGKPLCTPGQIDYNAFMCEEWVSNTSNVMFDPIIATDVYLPDLTVENGYACFNATHNEFKVKLTGKGNKVQVSKPT